ncbi:MAG: XRE family transcriptional regulator [bacterium]|nr:XRE family transcriptional regulator [bacterium]
MPSFEFKIDERSRAGSRFISRVHQELQKALAAEKSERKLTQQAIADVLGVDRSAINRKFTGLENLTTRSIGELLWAIGWEPYFEARKIDENDGGNEFSKPVITMTSSSSAAAGDNSEPRKIRIDQ